MMVIFFIFGFALPKEVSKRVMKEVGKTFELSDFTMEPVQISEGLNEELPIKISGQNLFRVIKDSATIGYAFTDQAPSKTAKFDYLVVFDKDVKIVNTKVLVYREDYGGEIGSRRWLKQFLGKTGGDHVSVKTNIDVISGATISVNSMTKSMDNLLATIGILQQKGKL
ncbi:FMN-binding protein [Muricauda sp. TY007]|nr:FMN-binding protein [Muricauda sp. TY007]